MVAMSGKETRKVIEMTTEIDKKLNAPRRALFENGPRDWVTSFKFSKSSVRECSF